MSRKNTKQSLGDRKTDLELAYAASEGDIAARRKLVEQLMDSVRRTVRYLAPSDRDGDDLAQQALVEVLRSVGSYAGHSGLEFWARRIVVRTSLRALKKRRRVESVVSLACDGVAGAQAQQNLESECGRQQLRARLTDLLSALPEGQRTAMVLKLVHNHSVDEVAALMDTPVDTVRSRLRSGRKEMRRRIQKDPGLMAWFEGDST